MFLGGAALIGVFAMVMSMVQTIITDDMRGRVMSVYNLAFRAGIPLGSLAIGKLIPTVGVSKAIAGAGLALVAISLYFLITNRESTFRPASQQI
jgi:predicted MFS family arabinose efflux permease